MKIGVKTFNDPNFLKKFEDKVDFFEIMTIEKNNYDFVKNLKLPIVIHSQHRVFGVNLADKTKEEKNISSLNFAKKIADMANAKKIIVHPGELSDSNCSRDQSIAFFKKNYDKKFIIENVPPNKNDLKPCMTPEDTKSYLKETKAGFCFDINHAIQSAVSFKKNYIDYIKEFIKLKPNHYHLGGQIIKENITHIALSEGDLDLKEVLKLLPKDAEITLEVSIDLKKTMEDVNILKNLLKELKID